MTKTVLILMILTAAAAMAAAADKDNANLPAGDRAIRNMLPDSEPTLAIWPGQAPDAIAKPKTETVTGAAPKSVLRIRDVSRPTITVCKPKDVPANGAAVIVCPGGGYSILAARKEGADIVRWLNSLGVTGVLLKYRVPRPGGDFKKHHHGLQDAQRAMGIVRHRAKDWGIDPNRVGILGFSAGGHLSASLCNNYDKRTYKPVDAADKLSCKPDFAVLVYPAYLKTTMGYGDFEKIDPLQQADKMSPQRTPPTFIAVSQADGYAGSGMAYFVALSKAKVPAALHVYPGGGHGTGMRAYPLSRWGKEAEQWMRDAKIIPHAEGAANAKKKP